VVATSAPGLRWSSAAGIVRILFAIFGRPSAARVDGRYLSRNAGSNRHDAITPISERSPQFCKNDAADSAHLFVVAVLQVFRNPHPGLITPGECSHFVV
jgi:hypothetical protein